MIFITQQPEFLTFHTVLHVLQVAQGNPHQTGVEHEFVLVFWSQRLWCSVEKENASVSCCHLVVADSRVTKAANHHLVPAIQKDLSVHTGLSFQVAPHSDL